MQRENSRNWDTVVYILYAIIVTSLMVCVATCGSGCKKKQPQPEPALIDTISVNQKQREDSLSQLLSYERVKNDSLVKVIKTSQKKVNELKQDITETKSKLKTATESGDTVAIIEYQREQISENESVIKEQDIQLSAQSQMILSRDTIIAELTDEISKQKREFKQVADDSKTKSLLLEEAQKQNDKLSKKLRKNRKIVSVAVPVGIVATTNSIVPQYTLPAVAVGVVIYLITKPKKN